MTLTGDFVTGQTVPFQRMRQALLDQGGGIQEGVVNAGDLMVTQRGAGANMSVDVAAGLAWVQIDTGTRNGLCHVTSDAVANLTVTASNGTNPRIDQIILRYNDTSIPTGSGNTPTLEVLTGTATSGATLANRTGATALPNDCMRLADILVPAASSSVTNTNIRDRRPWTRGLFHVQIRNTGDLTTTSASLVDLDATNLKKRYELSGAALRLTLSGRVVLPASVAGLALVPAINGVVPDNGADLFFTNQTGSVERDINLSWSTIPAAGSALIGWQWRSSGGQTVTARASTTLPLISTVEELVRTNTVNNSVTSG